MNIEPTLPKTDLYGMRGMTFLLANGQFFLAANSSTEPEGSEGFVQLCGGRFPLFPASTLEDIERQYFNQHRKTIEKRAEVIEKEIQKASFYRGLEANLAMEKDIALFLDIVMQHNTQTQIVSENYRPDQKGESNHQLVMPHLLTPGNASFLFVNGGMYPLAKVRDNPHATFKGQPYALGPRVATINQIESTFANNIDGAIEERAAEQSAKVREVTNEIEVQRKKNERMMRTLGISRHAHSFEAGNLGFDFTSHFLYDIIAPHSNSTAGRSYGEGESAATLTFENGQIGSDARFAERANRDYAFTRRTESHCFGGLVCKGQTLDHKISYLERIARIIENLGGYYQVSTSDDSSSY